MTEYCPYCGKEMIFIKIMKKEYITCLDCREAFCLDYIKVEDND